MIVLFFSWSKRGRLKEEKEEKEKESGKMK